VHTRGGHLSRVLSWVAQSEAIRRSTAVVAVGRLIVAANAESAGSASASTKWHFLAMCAEGKCRAPFARNTFTK
jgi:hypothetical protein